jgi:hypothetical protein
MPASPRQGRRARSAGTFAPLAQTIAPISAPAGPIMLRAVPACGHGRRSWLRAPAWSAGRKRDIT